MSYLFPEHITIVVSYSHLSFFLPNASPFLKHITSFLTNPSYYTFLPITLLFPNKHTTPSECESDPLSPPPDAVPSRWPAGVKASMKPSIGYVQQTDEEERQLHLLRPSP